MSFCIVDRRTLLGRWCFPRIVLCPFANALRHGASSKSHEIMSLTRFDRKILLLLYARLSCDFVESLFDDDASR